MKILHIIKKMNDDFAWKTARHNAEESCNEVKILLLHDAVSSLAEADFNVYACKEDVQSRGVITDVLKVDYGQIVKMLLNADSVVCW